MRRLAGFGLLLVLAAVVTVGAFLWSWTGAGPAEKPVVVVVPQGASLARAADLLEQEGALRSADLFRIQSRLLAAGGSIKAGEYEVPARASAADILALLQSGKTVQRFVVIPEGLPSVLVQERLAKAPHLSGPAPLPEEGSVLPDSYSYQRGETRAAVLARMQAAMAKELDRLWARRKPGIAIASKREAVILAAVVEKETAKPSERRMIAGVYTNRLKEGMKLDADPTVIYPITKGRPLGRRILRSELQADNGYNTYARAGLPAGPIANPGRESIAAVLDPAPTSALFFVADGTGGHVFADTLAEHNANVAKWYAIRRARGEM